MRIGLLLGLLGLVAFAGCGGSSDDDGGSSAPPVPKEELASRSGDALCNDLGACCGAEGYAYDVAGCKQTMQELVDGFLIDPAEKEGAEYDAQAAGDCLAWMQKSAKSCSFGEAPEACDRIYVGVKQTGIACESDIGCAPVPGADVQCEGQCLAIPRGKAGDACNGTCTDHGDGSSCSSSGQTGAATCWTNEGVFCGQDGTCQALLPIGAACSFEGCVSTAYCNDGTCAPRLGAGEPCNDAWEACQAGLYCSQAGVCVAEEQQNDFVSPEFCSGA